MEKIAGEGHTACWWGSTMTCHSDGRPLIPISGKLQISQAIESPPTERHPSRRCGPRGKKKDLSRGLLPSFLLLLLLCDTLPPKNTRHV